MPLIRIFLAFTALCLGCVDDSNDGLTDPPGAKPPLPSGEIAVKINVSGDPASGPGSYGVLVDGVRIATAAPNEEVKITAAAGFHSVGVAPFTSPAPFGFGLTESWCHIISTSQAVALQANSIAPIQFAVDCPPLEGTGRLTLVVAASGNDVPANFYVNVARLNGTPYSLTVTVPANSSLTNEVSVGALKAGIALDSHCTRSFGELLFGNSPRMLRAGSSLQLTFTVTCK